MINSDEVSELFTKKATFQNISSLIITIAIILFTRSIRWALLIRAVNKSGFPLKTLFYYSFLSQFYNSFLFFGTGDVAKVLSIKFDETQDRMVDIVTMTIIDRILDIIIIVTGGFYALLLLDIPREAKEKPKRPWKPRPLQKLRQFLWVLQDVVLQEVTKLLEAGYCGPEDDNFEYEEQ
ncbi:MAG: hypothetical protein HeimC2_26900 [Candidatus Heimdallarchaeota archaeon LC_2]|nr:MAG: hypothetical protein HeimC2_26900 [Candidatus Heimdallarchaeota archaeon LC_2]